MKYKVLQLLDLTAKARITSEIDNNSETNRKWNKRDWKYRRDGGSRGYSEKLEHILEIDVQEWEWDKALFEEINIW